MVQFMDIKGDLDLCSAVGNPVCDLIIKTRTCKYILYSAQQNKKCLVNLSWDIKVGLGVSRPVKSYFYFFFPLSLQHK